MKAKLFLTEEKLIHNAVNILIKELGPVEANRFLSFTTKQRVESVKRHHKWQSKLDKDKFFDSVIT